jgi:hypothetical protein
VKELTSLLLVKDMKELMKGWSDEDTYLTTLGLEE